MPRKPRTTPGMVTVISNRCRIVNGNVDSLRRMKPVGRPPKNGPPPVASSMPLARKNELADMNVRDGFQYVRSFARESQITEKRIVQEARYKELSEKHEAAKARFAAVSASHAQVVDSHTQTIKRIQASKPRSLVEHFDNDNMVWVSERVEPASRIERSVPGSFCNCTSNKDPNTVDVVGSVISCTVHGLKQLDCDCGGISGTTGYRSCSGHRYSGHTVGIKKDDAVLESANAKLQAAL